MSMHRLILSNVSAICLFSLPDWTKKVYVPGGDLEWVANHAFQISTNTTELARLKTGFLIREIVDRFAQKINSQLSPDRTLWMYSAHDTTVANVLNSLGLFYVSRNCAANCKSYFEFKKSFVY